MDLRLENIELHDSLHGCLAGQGTGTGIIEEKLAQQLAHLEQAPFFGVFIDLKKAFDAMDRGRCLAILSLHRGWPAAAATDSQLTYAVQRGITAVLLRQAVE